MHSWGSINFDVLGNAVVPLLNLNDFINAHLVCKNWQKACEYKPLTFVRFRFLSKCAFKFKSFVNSIAKNAKVVYIDDFFCTLRELSLIHHLSSLHSLVIQYCMCISDSELCVLFAKNRPRKLQSLTLSECLHITDDGFRYLSEYNQQQGLRSLTLTKCTKITDEGIRHLSLIPSLTHFSINYNINKDLMDKDLMITNKCIEYLSTMNNLTHLDIGFCKFMNDEGIMHMSTMSKLRKLRLSINKGSLTPNGICYLSTMINLKKLALHIGWPFQVTCKDLQQLSQLKLQHLELHELRKLNEPVDDLVQHISLMHSLKYFKLYGCQITENGVKYLSTMNELLHLELVYCDLTNDCLKYLCLLTKLRHLNISGSKRITHIGWKYLSTLTNLQTLDITYCLNFKCDSDESTIINDIRKLFEINDVIIIDKNYHYLQRYNTQF